MIKKCLCALTVLAMLAGWGCPIALANEWNPRVDALSAGLADAAWDGYAKAAETGDFAVMCSPEHCAMVTADGEGRIIAYPKAVYQPGEEHSPVSLVPLCEEESTGFQLIYGNPNGEINQWEACFVFDDRVSDNVGDWLLRKAKIGDLTVYRVDDRPELNLKQHIVNFSASYGVQYDDDRLDRCVQCLIDRSQRFSPVDWVNNARVVFMQELGMLRSMVMTASLMEDTWIDLYAIQWIRAQNERTGGWDGWPRYMVTTGQKTWWYDDTITLSSFNISLFPENMGFVSRLNELNDRLAAGAYCLGWQEDPLGEWHEAPGEGTVPVYSAPFEDAWRAEDGQAKVNLENDFWFLRGYRNADGESWTCIRYDAAPGVQRIGYVRAEPLGLAIDPDGDAPGFSFLRVPLEAQTETYLTDDPDASQASRIIVPEGAIMEGLGLYGHDYAYVAARVDEENRITEDGGRVVWGFVPLKYLVFQENLSFPEGVGVVNQEAMQALSGDWEFWAGGSLGPDFITFRTDGTFTAQNWDWSTWDGEPTALYPPVTGRWYVTRYCADWGLYWNDPANELHLIYEDGRYSTLGLTIDDVNGVATFGLTDLEGGGEYVPLGVDPWEAGEQGRQ